MASDITQSMLLYIDEIIALAKAAGESTLMYFKNIDKLNVQQKADHTPLTQADLSAHDILYAGLQKIAPKIPILSEEGDIPDYAVRQQWEHYWLLDPLDGTRGFVNGCAEYTVNIAFIEHHQPVLGVIYSPVDRVCYYAAISGGAFKQVKNKAAMRINTEPLDWSHLRVVLGHYHGERVPNLLKPVPNHELIRLNSSLKFGALAENTADVYPRGGPTSEWDTAAGQCILQEAGGVVVDLTGKRLHYNTKPELENPEFLAIGDPTQVDQLLSLFNKIRRKQ